MDAKTIKTIGWFLIAGSIGGTIGKLIGDHFFPDSKEVSYYINGKEVTKEEYGKWYNQLDILNSNVEQHDPGNKEMHVGLDMGVEGKPVVLDEKKMRSKKSPEVKSVDYSKAGKIASNVKASLEDLAKEKLEEEAATKKKEGPYVVSLEEHVALRNSYGSEILMYYEEDDVLVSDEEDDVLPNHGADIIGEDALTSFGEASQDPDIVYIRNERVGIDYEVIRSHKSYSEMVLGKAPPSKLKKNSRNTRKVKAEDVDESEE
jgi:hypothetical protein